MHRTLTFAVRLMILQSLFLASGKAQFDLGYKINQIAEQCSKGLASVEVSGLVPGDSLFVHWSTGENGLQAINLNAGDHNVSVRVKRRKDKVTFLKDTLLFFTLEKVECSLSVPKFFSPNGDLYNDLLVIGNIANYPNFELDIYNKWGQRVHSQKRNYEPWDGKWLGVNLPDGTYYYVIFFDAGNRNKLVKGDITILR